MSGYYPEGVTGHEWQINGPDETILFERECHACLAEIDDVDAYCFGYGVWVWDCPACGNQNETEVDDGRDV